MRIVCWNILQGGGTRLPAIGRAIREHEADVVVLNEANAIRLAELETELRNAGFRHRVHTEPAGRSYGSVVASRHRVERLPPAPPTRVLANCLLDVRIRALDLTLGAVYAPFRPPHLAPFWVKLLEHAAARASEPYLLVGDFNTGEGYVDAGRQLMGSKHFVRMRDLGYVDAWRATHGDAREFTWYSKHGGADLNGFRIDHAFASPGFEGRVRGCRYSHAEREARISDHSIVVLEATRAPKKRLRFQPTRSS
jgi:exodeoxyribonuclease-3